jgi:hypothetical protein
MMVSHIQFEYIDQDAIHASLKCSICYMPFTRPISTNCMKRHKFCRQCIEKWLQCHSACPICRQKLCADDLLSITEDIVVDLLNELQVKCMACGEKGIGRGDFKQHVKLLCPMATVNCIAKDIKCPWRGKREDLAGHVEKCSFQALRHLLFPLFNENDYLKQQMAQAREQVIHYEHNMLQLKEQVERQKSQIDAQKYEIDHLKNQLRRNSIHTSASRSDMARKFSIE